MWKATALYRFFAITFCFVGSALSPQAKDVRGFLEQYCFECHDTLMEKGDREFETFQLPLKTETDLITSREMIDQVILKEMPPKKAIQPSDEERLEFINAMRHERQKARSRFQSTGGRTIMRRLSTREYEYTLETLFGRRIDTLGLTEGFPKEDPSHHIDTIGQSQITSGFLLDQYFQAADRLVELRLNKPDIEPRDWHFDGNFKQYEELSGAHRAAFDYRYLCLYEQPNTDTRQGGYGHIEDFLEGVPVSGLYDIKVLAQAMHRDTHYDPSILRMDLSEPFLLAVVPGDIRKGHIHYPQRVEPLLAEPIEVPDDAPAWIQFRVWLEAGQTPRFIFPNGAYESRASVIQLNKRYKEELGRKTSGDVNRTDLLTKGKLPHIRISEISIHGPNKEPGGSLEEKSVFGEGGFNESQALEQILAFAERAFRRPLSEEDVEHLTKAYEQGLNNEITPRLAALDTLKLILCSPSFLYLSEMTPEDASSLSSYDLASRLSYALSSSPPDKTLMDLASDGSLVKDAVLRDQIERLLNNSKSSRFIKGFLDSWLVLGKLGTQPPPRKLALDYYAEDLPTSMKKETHLFFEHLLKCNGPVTDLLDADYTFVDKKLAKLYGLAEQDTLRLSDGFQRISLQESGQRGGLLGMAGVLMVSANGVETSPVTRGAWLAENILGTPPPPPPDEVPAIEPDVSGTTTIRNRLEKHRASKTCAECHRKIDPLGFPLENFDPLGRWRTKYQKNSKGEAQDIDASGALPSGESFTGFNEFKQVLKKHRAELFTRHLISQLLAYSTGRLMETEDQFEIDEIQETIITEGHGLRNLVIECLMSDIFRSR